MRPLRHPAERCIRASLCAQFAVTLVVVAGTSAPSSGGQAMPTQPRPDQDETLPLKPPPVPTGVIPLPQGAPPTGQQAPVPSPVRPLPSGNDRLRASPDPRSIDGTLLGRAITMREAVAIALYTSSDFAAAAAALKQAEGRVGQARAMLRPTVGANAQITEFDAPTTADLGALSGSAGAPPFVIVPQFNPTFMAAANLPLDVAGTLRSAVSQAQFQVVAARIDVNRVRNDTVSNVKTAFYNALRAQAQIAVATEAQNNAINRLVDANKNYAAGTAPRFDVISAQRDVADAQQGLINARAQLSVNLAALKNTIGVNIRSRLRITSENAVESPPGVEPLASLSQVTAPNAEVVVPPSPIETPQPQTAPLLSSGAAQGIVPVPATTEADDTFVFGPEYDGLLSDAIRMRPEVLEGDAQMAAARRGIQYARRSALPTFSVGISDTYTPNAAGFTRRNEAAVVLGVNLPLYDGGLARERVLEARASVATAEINRRRAVDQVEVDVQRAYIALIQARNRVAVTNVGLTQAREAFRLSRVRYNAGVSQQTGVSPQLELANAQNTLTQSQTNQVNALYDYNGSRAQLDRAVGRYSFTGSGPGYASPPSNAVLGLHQ